MNRRVGFIEGIVLVAVICIAGPNDGYSKLINDTAGSEETSDSQGNPPVETDVVREYYGTGAIKSETPYQKGKMSGKKKLFYENGNLQKEEKYVDGKREGASIEYYEDGART